MKAEPAPEQPQGDTYDRIIATAERHAEAEYRREHAANLCEAAGEHIRYMDKAACEYGET